MTNATAPARRAVCQRSHQFSALGWGEKSVGDGPRCPKMDASCTALLRHEGKQWAVGRVETHVRRNKGQASCETGPLLVGWVCLRGARVAAHIACPTATWLAASTTGGRDGSGLGARGGGDIRHAALGHASSPQLVPENGSADEHNDSQDVIRREKADQENEAH